MSDLIQNDYSDEIINKSLLGMTKIHNGLIVLDGCNAVLRKDYTNMIGKVKLISGGKAENELIYSGLVGPGMLTAAILGNTFCAPSVDSILKVIEEIEFHHSSGVLFIIQNYAEYPINFTSAKLHAEAKGHIVKIITVNSTSHHFGNISKEQNLLPIFFIYKIAGAMSEEGRNIDEIYSFCNSVANSGEMAFSKTEYENIISKEYELGMFSNLVQNILEPITNILNSVSRNQNTMHTHESKTFHTGHEVAIIISNFGCSQIETNIFILELLKQIETCGLKIKRIYVQSLITKVSGFHICLLNLSFTTILIKYLDFPTYAPAWPKILTSDVIDVAKDDTTQLTTPRKCDKNTNIFDINVQGPIISYETHQAFLLIISMACEAIIACTKQLNKMDQIFGNGDYGTSLARGANAIQNAIQQNKIVGTSVCVTFMQISQIIERTVGGVQGGLYSLFFYNVAKAFSEYQDDKNITATTWLYALTKANKAIKQLEICSMNDQILLSTLTAVQTDLKNAINKNMDSIDAFGVAVKTAENFAANILNMQSSPVKESKYPNPQAHAVGIWMRAAYEGTKLKLIYRHIKEG